MTNMIKMFKSRFDRFCHSMATSESMRITGDCTVNHFGRRDGSDI